MTPRPPIRVGIPSLLLVLLVGAASASAADAPPARNFPRSDDIARWNDRSTPRKALETFYFAILCYDLAPELIVNAVDCMDFGELDPVTRERDAALMAHELNGVMTVRSDLPLYGVPDRAEGKQVTLVDDGVIKIAMIRGSDGHWRFDKATVSAVPRMRASVARSRRNSQENRQAMTEGLADPETTARTFVHQALIRRNYSEAARCLDLRDVPPKLRSVRGPELARKLVFVMQRCAFLFPQEFPSEPEGWRFIWHSNHRGRIMLERVPDGDGKEAWLFSRMTLRNLDALVEGFRNVKPDPRYGRIGTLVEADVLIDSHGSVPPPRGVPAALGSPRATLGTLLQALEGLDFDDAQAQTALACLDLGEIQAAERTAVGLRLAAKLEAILRPLDLDLLGVSDSWASEPLRLGHDNDAALVLSRQADGAWRFDQESVARIPEMFGKLTPVQKTAIEKRTPFHSARQTTRTLLTGVRRGDLALAAECLDLDEIPAGARADVGPLLAYKLAYVLNKLGRVVVQEIPNEPDGPGYHVYRGSLGRVAVARRVGVARTGDWLFTTDTVRRIDAMFQAVLERPVPRTGGEPSEDEITPPWSVRIRAATPAGLRTTIFGLAVYQWLGLGLVVLVGVAVAWMFQVFVNRVVHRCLGMARFNLGEDFVVQHLRPLGFQVGLRAIYLQLGLLDLPVALLGFMLPAVKFIWVGLLAWTIFRLLDLGMGMYTNSEHLNVRSGLSDMIAPTAARAVKFLVFVAAFGYQVYIVGGGEWLTKLLAGVGLVGLAASLAAQDSLKSFFGTLLLIAEHPFKLGDLIVVNGMEGRVESVGFRSTRIRTLDDSLLTVSNAVLASVSIENRGARKCRRYNAFVSMAYDTPVDRMTTFRDALREAALARPDLVRADRVDIHVHSLADCSVELLVNLYFWVTTYREEMEARDWLNLEILTLAEMHEVEIAFPTQTVHIADDPRRIDVDSAHPGIPAPKFALGTGGGRGLGIARTQDHRNTGG